MTFLKNAIPQAQVQLSEPFWTGNGQIIWQQTWRNDDNFCAQKFNFISVVVCIEVRFKQLTLKNILIYWDYLAKIRKSRNRINTSNQNVTRFKLDSSILTVAFNYTATKRLLLISSCYCKRKILKVTCKHQYGEHKIVVQNQKYIDQSIVVPLNLTKQANSWLI